ncbi:MAG: site-specific integrase [Gaiellaceae bacterium]
MPPIAERVTNHTLRRTFASLLYEAGASPAYVMSQMGHTSAGRGKDGKVQRSFAFAEPFGRRSPFAQRCL